MNNHQQQQISFLSNELDEAKQKLTESQQK